MVILRLQTLSNLSKMLNRLWREVNGLVSVNENYMQKLSLVLDFPIGIPTLLGLSQMAIHKGSITRTKWTMEIWHP